LLRHVSDHGDPAVSRLARTGSKVPVLARSPRPQSAWAWCPPAGARHDYRIARSSLPTSQPWWRSGSPCADGGGTVRQV